MLVAVGQVLVKFYSPFFRFSAIEGAMEPDTRTAEQRAWDKIIKDERHLFDLSRRVTAIELVLWDRIISRIEAQLDSAQL